MPGEWYVVEYEHDGHDPRVVWVSEAYTKRQALKLRIQLELDNPTDTFFTVERRLERPE